MVSHVVASAKLWYVGWRRPSMRHGERPSAPDILTTSDGLVRLGLQSASCVGASTVAWQHLPEPFLPPWGARLSDASALQGSTLCRCTSGASMFLRLTATLQAEEHAERAPPLTFHCAGG